MKKMILLILTIILFKFVFKIDFKKTKSLQENKDAEEITDKFPENIEIAKEMLEILGNEGVKIEEAKEETVDYSAMTLTELKEVAKTQGVKGYSKMKKEELINALN